MRGGLAMKVAIAALLAAEVAGADADDGPLRATARTIAQSGAAYFDAGAWDKARDHFHRAYQLVPAPTLLLMEARALVQLGRLVDAIDAYGKVAETPLDAGANDAYRRAVGDARQELAELAPRVPVLRIVSQEPIAELRVDGVVVPPARQDAPVQLDPGTHVVEAVAKAGTPVRETFAVGERESHTLTIPSRGPGAARPRARGAVVTPLVWVTLGTGVAGVVVGATTGLMAAERKARLDDACPDHACPESAAADLDAYSSLRTASVISYGIGAAGVVTGVVLLLTQRREVAVPSTALSVAAADIQVGPRFGRDGVGLEVMGCFR
jgi:hypothetical protein